MKAHIAYGELIPEDVYEAARGNEAEKHSVEAGKIIALVEESPELVVGAENQQTPTAGHRADDEADQHIAAAYVLSEE